MKKIAVYYPTFDLSEYSNTVVKRIIFTLILAAAATSLIVIGFTFGLTPFARHLSTWQESKSYIPTDAQVLNVEFLSLDTYSKRKGREHITRSDISKTYQTEALFAYQYQGKKYFSYRINLLTETHDGRDSYAKEIFDLLNAKYKTNTTVTLWVNPQHPDYAVYDRSIIWPAFILLIPFALAFPIAGIALIFYAVSLWRQQTIPEHMAGVPVYRSLQVEPPKLITGIFAFLIYNFIMWPISPNAWSYQAEGSFPLIKMIVIVWSACGLIPLFNIFQAFKSKKRLGELYLLIMPPESQFTKLLHGQIQFVTPLGSRMKPTIDPITITLNLEYFGRYKDRRNSKFNFCSQWHSQDVVISAPINSITQSFELTFPEKIIASPYDRLTYLEYYWTINLEIAGSIAQFKLPSLPNIPKIVPTQPKLHLRP